MVSACFSLDFVDWVKAGCCGYLRGSDDSSRKVAYFQKLYAFLEEERFCLQTESRGYLADSLYKYYEDLFYVYKESVASSILYGQSYGISVKEIKFADLILVPCFDQCDYLAPLFEREPIEGRTYTPENLRAVKNALGTNWIDPDTDWFKCMAILFDYGCRRKGNGVLLEVNF